MRPSFGLEQLALNHLGRKISPHDTPIIMTTWITVQAFQAIVYGTISCFAFAVLGRWIGLWRWMNGHIALRRGLARYRADLIAAITSATVVDRRQGFDINEVYVELDLAPSDLMAVPSLARRLPKSAVLVGGPGAGKSTYVKYRLLLDCYADYTAFFLRLRDYAGEESVDTVFVTRLKHAGIRNAEEVFENFVLSEGTLIVLDGLDEVRPIHREAVYRRLDAFYHKYFGGRYDVSELIITCRKEAYRAIPLSITDIWEVRPLTDEQIARFAAKWPLEYPAGKSADAFCADLDATPKILELARSPLLLIGGLMQYSESNLGIPEERFQYLARIGRWLISDWAAAQGLPPDPQRPLYDRILPRLALAMHEKNTVELPIDVAVRLLADWLPHYGVEAHDATKILDGIFTRTGILVRDVPGAIVFSQFSLQEYFASTLLAFSPLLIDVITTRPSAWWREAVLLSLAQSEDPTAALDELFKTDAVLAAEAVAECPTPSIALQEKAADAAVAAIDEADDAAHRATVALLRKVATTPEWRLCAALETRLRGDTESSGRVGLILAHAGTQAATKLLAAHPEIWERCLRNAGYLSSNFENLLVSVIVQGDESFAIRAAESLCSRLSRDRRNQLVSLLPTLASRRAGVLAVHLLRQLEVGLDDVPSEFDDNLADISSCAAKISELSALPPRRDMSAPRYPPPLGEVCVVVAAMNDLRDNGRIAAVVNRGLRWPHDRRSIAAMAASLLAGMSAGTERMQSACFFGLAACLVIVAGLLPERTSVRRSMRHPLVLYRSRWPPAALASGGIISLAFAAPAVAMPSAVRPEIAIASAFVFATAAAGTISGHTKYRPWRRIPVRRRFVICSYALWLTLLAIILGLELRGLRNVRTIVTVLSFVGLGWLLVRAVSIKRDVMLFDEACEVAANAYVYDAS